MTNATEAEARTDIRNLLRRVQTARRRAGLAREVDYVIGFSGISERIHCHLIVEGGLDRSARTAWTRGANGPSACSQTSLACGACTYLMNDPKEGNAGAQADAQAAKITYRKLTHRQAENLYQREYSGDLFERLRGYEPRLTPPNGASTLPGCMLCPYAANCIGRAEVWFVALDRARTR